MMVIEYFYYKKKYLWCKIMWKIRVKSVYNMSINVVKYPVIGGRKAHRKFTEYCIHLLIWTSGMKNESFFFSSQFSKHFGHMVWFLKWKNMYKVKKQMLGMIYINFFN